MNICRPAKLLIKPVTSARVLVGKILSLKSGQPVFPIRKFTRIQFNGTFKIYFRLFKLAQFCKGITALVQKNLDRWRFKEGRL